MKLYRSYYRCCKCHSKVGAYTVSRVTTQDCKCPKDKFSRPVYKCQHDYWYGLLFLTLRDIWRKIIK